MSQIFKPQAAAPPPPGFVVSLTASTGTNPVPPNGADTIFVGGTLVSARSTPITTVGIAAGNTVDVQLQIATTSATSVLNNVGLSSFNSAQFTIDSFGFVSLNGTGVGETITGQSGGALSPVAGNWNIFGGTVAAGTTPVATSGTGNTLTVNVQTAQAIASTNASNIGMAAFNSAQFTVDANGFVSTTGSGVLNTLTPNSGTSPVVPTGGTINVLGTGSTTTVGSLNTLTVELTGLTNHAVLVGAGTATITKVGPSASTGQILQNNAGADPSYSTATYPSTTTINQILYSSSANVVAGLATANQGVLTTGTTGIPVITSLAGNGELIIGSTAGAPAAATLTAGTGISITNGSNSITIAVNGAAVGETITGQSGGALSPTAGNWNIFGDGVTASGTSTAGNIITSGAGSTLTISPTQAQFMTNYTQVLIGASPYTALVTDYYISAVSSGGAITIKLPNAPTTNRLFIIKDNAGDASVNNISVTTVGGAVTIDGQTTYTIAGNFGSINLLFNGTSYEVF